MEYLRYKQRIAQRRRTRVFGLLGALFLLLGLILKVQAQAPIGVENPSIHTFQPELVEEVFPVGTLHPKVKFSPVVHPPHVQNPTAQADIWGQSCQKCHSNRQLLLDQDAGPSGYSELALQGHGKFNTDYACESCHLTQVSLVNKGTLLH
jgi:hypothetical protein